MARALRRLTLLALTLSTIFWFVGHFLSVRLTFDNTASLTTFSCRFGSGIGLGCAPSDRRFAANRGIAATLTICDRHAVILDHRSFTCPFDPTRLRLPYFELPFWALIPALAAANVLQLRRERRLARRANHCPSCAYDLSGLPPRSACPECGRAPSTIPPCPPH